MRKVCHRIRLGGRAFLCLAAVCLPALAAAAADESAAVVASHKVYLTNGDSMTGDLQWLCRAEGVDMRPIHGGANMQVGAGSLRGVLFHPLGRRCLASGAWLVELHNGERFPVDMLEVGDGSLAVETGWAGRLEMPWDQVRALRCNGHLGDVLFSGPEASQPWLVESVRREGRPAGRGWRHHDAVIRGTGSGVAALDWDLPDTFALDFFMRWTGAPSISLALFADTLQHFDEGDPSAGLVMDNQRMEEGELPFHSGLVVTIDDRRVGVNWHALEGRRHMIGDSPVAIQFRESGAAWICVYVDKNKGVIELEVDGRWIGSWRDAGDGEFSSEGRGLTFFRNVGSRSGYFGIDCLRVREWNGEPGMPQPQKASRDHDVIITRQGDRIRGQLGALKDQRWNVEADLGVLEIGLDDIVEVLPRVAFGDSGEEAGFSAVDEMPIVLAGGYFLRSGDFEVRNGVVRLTHPLFGPIAFDPGLLHGIVYPES